MPMVTTETLFDALLAWDAWEQAAVRATDLTNEVTAADYKDRVSAAWTEVERLRDAAKVYEVPRRLSVLGGTVEERVLRSALVHARDAAEERVRAYTKDITDAQVGAGGEDADG